MELSYELESIRYLDFDGAWPGSFSAHPKLDPITGELQPMGYYWEWDHVKYVVVRPDGTIRKVVEVPVPGRIMLHDVGITDSSILIFDLPVTFQLDALGEGYSVPVPVGSRPSALASECCRGRARPTTSGGPTSSRATCSTR